MHIGNYLTLVASSEQQLAEAFVQVAYHHADEPDIFQLCQRFANWSRESQAAMQPFIARYEAQRSPEPERLLQSPYGGPRSGNLALLRDLQDLWLLTSQVHLFRLVISQGALALQDKELETSCLERNRQSQRQLDWLLSRIKVAAPQLLAVAE